MLLSSLLTNAQVQRQSYSANVYKIDLVRFAFRGCSLGPCWTWWSIALREPDELLLQTGGHQGSRSRNYPAGCWKITGDTLALNMAPEFFDSTFMRTKYLIAKPYNCRILLPIDETIDWSNFLVDLQRKFESTSSFERAKSSETPETDLYIEFGDFIREEYKNRLKILVEDINPAVFVKADLTKKR